MYYPQRQLTNLRALIQPGKVIVIYGARRVGKTTLLNKFVEALEKESVLFVNGDDITARQFLESQSIEKLDVEEIRPLRARAKITSHFRRRCILAGGVVKVRNMLDIPALSRLASQAPRHLNSVN